MLKPNMQAMPSFTKEVIAEIVVSLINEEAGDGECCKFTADELATMSKATLLGIVERLIDELDIDFDVMPLCPACEVDTMIEDLSSDTDGIVGYACKCPHCGFRSCNRDSIDEAVKWINEIQSEI